MRRIERAVILAGCLLVASVRVPDAAPARQKAESAKQKPTSCDAGQLALGGGSFVSRRAAAAAASEATSITPLCLDATEVTVAAYRACVEAGSCSAPDRDAGEACNWGDDGAAKARAAHPINCVDHAQAAAFCAWRGQRLPTAGELEWAQRGGAAATRYPWGDDEAPRNVCAPARSQPASSPRDAVTCPVAACRRSDSPAGAHDLSGNVAEWTATAGKLDGERLVCGGQTLCQRALAKLSSSLAAGSCLALPATEKREGTGFRCARAAR